MAKRLTFYGGTVADGRKLTQKHRTEAIPSPASITLKLGKYHTPCVNVGDRVCMGQRVAESTDESIACPVFSGISGRVSDIGQRPDSLGIMTDSITIINDGEGLISPDVTPYGKSIIESSPEEIIDVIRNAGIYGLDGDDIPCHIKLRKAAGRIKMLIINGAESEPYLTNEYRLLLEHPERVINGCKILMRALSLRQTVIAVEDNKLAAVNKLEDALGDSRLIKVKLLKGKYPQCDERMLVYALTGKEIPAGADLISEGYLVLNVQTVAAVFRTFLSGMPMTERRISVTGENLVNPKNLHVPFGTPVSLLIEYCGGYKHEASSVVVGGPFSGHSAVNIEAPSDVFTSAVIVLPKSAETFREKTPSCIRCGRCYDACPMRLLPLYIAENVNKGDYKACAGLNAAACSLCGACEYVCPSSVPLMMLLEKAKNNVPAAAVSNDEAVESKSLLDVFFDGLKRRKKRSTSSDEDDYSSRPLTEEEQAMEAKYADEIVALLSDEDENGVLSENDREKDDKDENGVSRSSIKESELANARLAEELKEMERFLNPSDEEMENNQDDSGKHAGKGDGENNDR